MTSSPRSIRTLPFKHNQKPALGFEVFRLSSLFERGDRGALPVPLDKPVRVDFHTVYVGISGRGRMAIDFAPVPIGRDTVTFVARGRTQSFPDRAVDAWMLLFTPEFLSVTPGSPDPLVLPAILSPLWAEPALAPGRAEQRELMGLVEQIAEEHARPLDRIQVWLLSSLLRALLLRCERIAGAPSAPHAALATFLTILERDHETTRSVAHYAKAAGVSVRRLAELVVAETGKSTKQIIDERVVLEHKRLLAYTNLSVKQIAAETGFDEPTNLVKFFRRHTGTTPLEFRAAHQVR